MTQENIDKLIESNHRLAISNQDLAHSTKELVAINKEAIVMARLNHRLLDVCGGIVGTLGKLKDRDDLEESWYVAITTALNQKEL